MLGTLLINNRQDNAKAYPLTQLAYCFVVKSTL